MEVKVFVLWSLIGISSNLLFAQDNQSIQDTLKKEKSGKVFGMIYGGGYHKLKNYSKPKSGFEIKTGILGYKNQLSDKVNAVIMFDVSKTTRDIKSDSISINYTEGNHYTVYLKQAEIQWKFVKYAELSFGMILSSQYLITQDKFWNHRFIEQTFQEVNKYGFPADFGTRLKLFLSQKVTFTLNMLNGDGPARWQDENGKFLFSGDIEYKYKEQIFKIYTDYKQAPASSQKAQSIINGFVGINIKRIKLGTELCYIHHVNFSTTSIMGYSGFAFYKINPKLEILGRFDSFEEIVKYEQKKILLTGIQYEPINNYFLSINYRAYWPIKTAMIYFNFGAKF